MKKSGLVITGVVLFLSLLIGACAVQPVVTQTAPETRAATTAVTAQQEWQKDWESTLSAARKEGKVVVYTGYTTTWRQAFDEAMSKKYGITVEAVIGRSGEIAERIMREQVGRVYYADMLTAAPAEFKTTFQPAGILQSLEGVLILPEVLDPRAWWRGQLPWLDPDTKTFLNYRETVSPPITINTALVKPDEVKSWNDLLNPLWKGKIVLSDPTVPGSGATLVSMLAYRLMDWDYVTRLVKQEPVLSGDNRQMAEWVARGKYPILLGPKKENVIEFIQAGAPITFVTPSEGTFLETGPGYISRVKTGPNPNAAKIFINFFLSREGQILEQQATGYQSSRGDVPTGMLLPIVVRPPGAKYPSTGDKEFVENVVQLRDRGSEMFRLLKR